MQTIRLHHQPLRLPHLLEPVVLTICIPLPGALCVGLVGLVSGCLVDYCGNGGLFGCVQQVVRGRLAF